MRKNVFFLTNHFLAIGIILLLANSCKKDDNNTNNNNDTENSSSFTDVRDGNTYKIVKIGNQVWMAENLRYLLKVFGKDSISSNKDFLYVWGYNGTNIQEAKATTEYKTYGVLYNWVAACNYCPSGWHLPSQDEWNQLINYLGGYNVAGGKLKESGVTHWDNPNSGTNESGFTALPSGDFSFHQTFDNKGFLTYWWSTNPVGSLNATCFGIENKYNTIYKFNQPTREGHPVRCIKN